MVTKNCEGDRNRSASSALQESVLSSLRAHIAVLDADGTIIHVNEAWTAFANARGAGDAERTGVGINYVDVCRKAARTSATAREVLDGILEVLRRRKSSFSYEYACHEPDRKQWYQMHVTPLAGDSGVVISHENITDRRRAEETVHHSELLFSAVVNNSLDAIVILRALRDENGQIIDFEVLQANPRCAEVAGLTVEQLHGRRLLDLLPKLGEAGVVDAYRTVVETGSPAQWDTFVEDDLVTGWFTISAVKVEDGLAVTFRDITTHKEREDALRQATDRFEALGQTIPGVIYTCVMDADGTFRLPYLSEGGAAVLGGDSRHLMEDASAAIDLVHPDDRADFFASTQESVKALKSWRWEGRFILDNEEKWIYAASEPRRRSDGGYEWHGMAMDITPRVRAEQALRESKKHQQALFEQSLDAVLIADDRGQVIDANPAAGALFERSHDELCGVRLWELDPTYDAKQGRREWDVFLQKGTASGEYRLTRSDGSVVEIEARSVANVLEGRHLSVLRDVTQRKQTQAVRNRLAALVESSNDAIIGKAPDGSIVDWNEGAEKLFGYAADEIRGRSGNILVPESGRAEAQRIMEGLSKGEGCRDVEVVRRRKDGSLVDVWLSASPIFDDRGEIVGASGIVRDISAQKEFIRETMAARQRAEEMSRLKSSFLTNMSHEIRTPLTGIIGFADILTDQLTGDQRELANFIAESGERLTDMLTSVLDLAQLESGQFTMNMEPVDVVRHARRTVDVLSPQAESRGIYLSFVLDSPQPILAMADAPALSRILTSLCSNAVKFTREGGVIVRISRSGSRVVLNVRDTGVGIDPNFLPFIFDEYKQESVGSSREFEGTGLGLTLSKRLADLMNAELTVESVKGEGTTFTLVLDAAEADQSRARPPRLEEPAEDDSRAEAMRNGSAPADHRQRRPIVLLVDENVVEHATVRSAISDYADVDCVTSAGAALVIAAETNYDAVILDMDLGGGTRGEYMLRELRSKDDYANVPVIGTSGRPLGDVGDRFLKLGLDAYLTKPVRTIDFQRVLTEVLAPQSPR